jgi:hypothetical protein
LQVENIVTKELEEGNRKRAMARLKVPDRTASVGLETSLESA